jgi:hypothetical protein
MDSGAKKIELCGLKCRKPTLNEKPFPLFSDDQDSERTLFGPSKNGKSRIVLDEKTIEVLRKGNAAQAAHTLRLGRWSEYQ